MYVSVKQTAEKYGVCTRTVRRWLEHGLPYLKSPGRNSVIRINTEDIEKFLKEGVTDYGRQ